MIDQNSKEGKALQAAVQKALRKYLGADYSDDVLPLYIVVMLAHGNEQQLVAENLDAFLGKENAVAFADWLFKHLAEVPGRYETQPPPAGAHEEPAPIVTESPAAVDASNHEDSGRHKRRREKRDKIEWKAEPVAKSSKDRVREREREQRGDDKRRRSGDAGENTERLARSDRLDRALPSFYKERDREHEREARHRAEPRDDRDGRRKERHGERSRRHEERLEEPISDRRRGREHDLHEESVREDGVRGRGAASTATLRSKVVLPRSRSRSPPHRPAREISKSGRLLAEAVRGAVLPPALTREDARPSVFDRLAPANAEEAPQPCSSAAGRTEPVGGPGKMRMDSVPGSAAVVQPVEEEDTMDVQAELRRVQAQLAELQKEKSMSVVGRSVVVHNVHFNATPAILTAHFSGCGPIANVNIERDPNTGHAVGVATIEFEESAAKQTALTLSGSILLDRPITVYAKNAAPPYNPAPFRPYVPQPVPFTPSGFGRGGFASRGRGTYVAGRGTGRGAPRPVLMRNKYIRPKDAEKPVENGAVPAAVNVGSG